MRHPENGELARQELGSRQIIEGGDELAPCQVTGGSENDHDAGISHPAGDALAASEYLGLCHCHLLHQADFFSTIGTTCPPNFCRIAESTFASIAEAQQKRRRKHLRGDRLV